MEAAAFSATAMAPMAAGDADWAVILHALRQKRKEAKAARQHIARVEGAQPDAACSAATALQAAWRAQMACARARLERRAQLVHSARRRLRLRGSGCGGGVCQIWDTHIVYTHQILYAHIPRTHQIW